MEEEKTEKELYTYTYTDYKSKEIIFECVADDILEADKKYIDTTGHDPKKQNNIGCSISAKGGSASGGKEILN
ncbi:MAG: hypothetical protein Q8L47_02895 [bacterium]|nr:hypothetical protein [bacterium]